MASANKTIGLRSIAKRTVALLVTLVLVSSALIQVTPREADAIGSFDAEVLRLINNHRASIGLNPLIEYAPFSNAALNWSTTMRNQSPGTCSSAGFRHDSFANVASQGLPPGADGGSARENIGWACGPIGYSEDQGFSWPSECRGAIDYTTPLLQFCGWINSAGHRAAIETASLTHIGLGTAFNDSNGQRVVYSTNRFVRAPIVPTTCNGRAITVNMTTGVGSPTNGSDVIVGTAGADVIDGLGGNDLICGLGGNDTIRGGTGADVIFGGAGNDNIRGGDQGDIINGGAGNDIMLGEAGWDKLTGATGRDTIYGGSGSDQLFGGGDADILHGEAGNDLILGYHGDDTITGGPGKDLINGQNDHDTIDGGDDFDQIWGRLGNDTINGGGGPDWIWGYWGADTIDGGDGWDRIFAEGHNDIIRGGNGNDVIDGGFGFDTCDGQAGNDTATSCESVTSAP